MIKLKHLVKQYDQNVILNNISLELNKGDLIGIIGPSGSGKSTFLRCIAGIEKYEMGSIHINKECRIGMVFQNFNIFNNMSVIDNLCYAQQKVLKRSRYEAEGIAIQILKKVQMMHYFDRYPNELSGGQKQRIGIARTLCMSPSVILFDEPTSALDPENVKEVLDVIKSVATEDVLIVIATHEIRFIKSIANRIIFMDDGHILLDTTKDIFFNEQKNERILNFLDVLLSH